MKDINDDEFVRADADERVADTGVMPCLPLPRRKTRQRKLSLALQGGGSFGAFTWGFLDRLLEDDGIGFDAVSGASAGAINAVVLAAGLASGNREQARERLQRFWQRAAPSCTGNGSAYLSPMPPLRARWPSPSCPCSAL